MPLVSQLLSCGLRVLGWAPVLPAPAAGAPFGSRSAQSAAAPPLRFVQRALAELKSEMARLRQAAPGRGGPGQKNTCKSYVTDKTYD